MYEKLQTVLQQCLDKGWKPFIEGSRTKDVYFKQILPEQHNVTIYYVLYYEDGADPVKERIVSYHDLFSKESWLMEFVERKNPSPYYMGSVTSKEALEIKLMNHYCKMSQLRAEEKIQYFLDNIIVDNG